MRRSFTFSFRAWALAALAAVVGTVAAFLGATEWLIRAKVEPHDLFRQSVDVFFAATSPDAVFGDSMTARGFQGRHDFANLGYPADSVLRISIKVDAYYRRRDPGRVVIAWSFSSFWPRPGTTANYDLIFNGEGRSRLRFAAPEHEGRLIRYWETLLSGQGFQPKAYFTKHGEMLPTDAADEDAFVRTPREEREALATAIATLNVPPPNYATTENAQILRRTLQRLRQRGARICLVTFPIAAEYRAAMKAHPRYAQAKEFFGSLATEAGGRFVDLWDLFDEPDYFMDLYHVNSRGAKITAQVVVERCFPDAPEPAPAR